MEKVNIRIGLLSAAIWIAGIIIAKGFWSTLAAVVIPFWGLYLVIDLLLTKFIL